MNDTAAQTKALLIRLISAFTCKTDAIQVETTATGHHVTHVLRVAQEDYHKVVGSGGHRINALIAIFRDIGLRNNVKLTLTLVSMPRSEQISDPKFQPNTDWNHLPTCALIRDLFGAMNVAVGIDAEGSGIATWIKLKFSPVEHDILVNKTGFTAALGIILVAIGRKEGRSIYLDSFAS